MSLSSAIARLTKNLQGLRSRRNLKKKAPARASLRPCLEVLEDRTLPTGNSSAA